MIITLAARHHNVLKSANQLSFLLFTVSVTVSVEGRSDDVTNTLICNMERNTNVMLRHNQSFQKSETEGEGEGEQSTIAYAGATVIGI